MGNFHTSKALGQNFITDFQVIDDIVEASCAGPEDLVIEIGPGDGALTESLIETAGKVVAIELDDRLIPILKAKFGMCDNFELVHEDVLKVNLAELIAEKKGDLKNVRILGNLPYYITTPILMMVLEAKLPIESFTIMVQKEVAERLASDPGKKAYGAISASVQYYAEIEYVRTVTRDLFRPAPKVDSAVINLLIRKEPPVDIKSEEAFFEVIRQSFSQRRKTLGNSLCGIRGLGKAETSALLEKSGIDPQRRAETLSLDEFAAISNNL